MIGAIIGGLLVSLSALLLYLAAPHQRWGALPYPPSVAGWSGLILLLVGTRLLLGWAGAATAIFIVMALLMTIWSVVPLAIAWWRSAGEDGK